MSQKRVSGFPEKRGTSGEVRGTSGEVRENFRGSLGNFRGTSGLLFSSTVRELPGKSPKTSGEARGTSGEVRGLSRSSGEPDSLPVTRQICLQIKQGGLSGPVLRDTARLSQRYPPIARYGVLGVSTWPIGCDTPSSFYERFPL